MVAPLTSRLSSKVKFKWSPLCQQVFTEVKALISSAPVFLPQEWESLLSCRLPVDASELGAGTVFLQTDDDSLDHLVNFFFQKFNSYQLNYSIVEKEAVALIWPLQHFENYVDGGGEPLFLLLLICFFKVPKLLSWSWEWYIRIFWMET